MSGQKGFFSHTAARYATSVIAVGVAFLLRHAFSGFFGAGLTYITFSPAVMVAAVLGGLGPGLLATVLAAMAALWILPPEGIFVPLSTPDAVGLVMFCVMGMFMSSVASLYHRARGRVATYEKELALREEQARAALEIERQRQLLEVTLASIGDGVIVTDSEGRVTSLNGEAERLTGWRSEEAAGQPLAAVFNIINEDTRQPVENPADKVLRLGVTVGLANHTLLIAKDGRETPIDDSGAPIRLEGGKVQGVVLVFRDFTQRRAAEEALVRAKREWERTFDSASDLIALIDPQHGILRANRAMAERLGLSPEGCIGLPCYRHVHGTECPPSSCPHTQLLADGCEHVAEIHEERLGGDFLVTCTPLRDEQGRMIASVHIAHDITARKQAEAALRESEERFRTMADAIPQLAWIAKADGWIYWYNRRWHEYTGTTPEQMEGWGWQSVHDPAVLPSVMEQWTGSIATGQPFDMTFPLRGADGVFRPFLTRVMPLRDAQGRVQQWFGTNTDVSEQKQAEEKLRQQREWLRVTLTSIGDAVMTCDAEGRVTFLNPVAEELSGWKTEEALGQPIKHVFKIINEQTQQPAEDIAARVLREGHVVALANHTALVTRDGREVPIEDSAAPITDSAGGMAGVVLVFHDVTEKRRAQEALRRSERRYRSYVDLTNQFAWVTNASGEVVEDVPSLRAFTGQTYEEAQGTGWARALHPEDLQRTIEIWNHAVSTRKLYEIEYRMRRHDGVYRLLLARGVPIMDEGGIVLEWVGTCIDITERKQAEEALRQSEEQLRVAALAAEIGVWFWTPGTSHVIVSANWRHLFGVDPDALVTFETWRDALHPEDRDHAVSELNAAREQRREFNLEYRVVRPDGTLLWIVDRGRAWYDEHGSAIGMAGVNVDITERKRVEDELRQANEQLAEADRRKDEFLAMLAHELRNPLAPVRNAVAVLRLTGPNEAILQRQRSIIDRQVTHMARLLDDLLDVSRITRGKITLQKQPLALLDVLAHAAEVVAPLVESRRHTLHLSLPPASLQVEGDLDRLAQVVGNLLTNAAKYTPEGGQIWLEAAREDDQAVVRVRDNGVGIAPEMLPRVFDLFAQAERSLDRSQGGLGIGLTTAQSLVEMHGGSMEARSDGSGQGSEFTVHLPALPEAAEATALSTGPCSPASAVTKQGVKSNCTHHALIAGLGVMGG